MGTLCSSAINNRGQIFIMKLLILLTALATVALAEPWGYYGYPAVYNVPSLQWPGKRSAEADAEPHYGFYGYPAYAGFYGYHPYAFRPVATSFESRSPQGAKAKRSAEAEPAYGYYGYGYGFPYYHQQA